MGSICSICGCNASKPTKMSQQLGSKSISEKSGSKFTTQESVESEGADKTERNIKFSCFLNQDIHVIRGGDQNFIDCYFPHNVTALLENPSVATIFGKMLCSKLDMNLFDQKELIKRIEWKQCPVGGCSFLFRLKF
jgi:hypothetical protein